MIAWGVQADVSIGGASFAFVSAYFPHSDYGDTCVLEVYHTLVRSNAKAKKESDSSVGD